MGIGPKFSHIITPKFTGNLEGTFYLSDIRLIAQPLPPNPGLTAVLEHRQDTAPADFILDQNYPNPFNSDTVIRFAPVSVPAADRGTSADTQAGAGQVGTAAGTVWLAAASDNELLPLDDLIGPVTG